MEVSVFSYWRTQDLLEINPAPSLKRYDTAPELAVELTVGGTPLPLLGASITGRVRFQVTLLDPLSSTTTMVRTTLDARLRRTQVLLVGSERMKVVAVDSASEPGATRLTVLRAQGGTAAAVHELPQTVGVLAVERLCTLLVTEGRNRFFLPWIAGDFGASGAYQVEFEVRDSSGRKFSVPSGTIPLTVTDDFTGS